MRSGLRGASSWFGWLCAMCSVACLVAAANSHHTWRAFARTEPAASPLVSGARGQVEFWLSCAAVAAAGAVATWLVRRAARGDSPAVSGAPTGEAHDGEHSSGAVAMGTRAALGSAHGAAAAALLDEHQGGRPADALDWRRPSCPRPVHWTDRARWVLALGWVVALVIALVVGARPASYDRLLTEVQAGAVSDVTVSGTLQPGDGTATQDVTWRRGWTHYRTEVVWAEPGVEVSETSADGQPGAVLRGDVGQQLTRAAPGLVVHSAAPTVLTSVTFLGWYLPGGRVLGPLLLAGALLALVLIVNAPPPWRLTRWAWFWVGFTPVGVVLFALLAGPTPGLPGPRHPQRRLGGVAAFVLALVLAPLLHWSIR